MCLIQNNLLIFCACHRTGNILYDGRHVLTVRKRKNWIKNYVSRPNFLAVTQVMCRQYQERWLECDALFSTKRMAGLLIHSSGLTTTFCRSSMSNSNQP